MAYLRCGVFLPLLEAYFRPKISPNSNYIYQNLTIMNISLIWWLILNKNDVITFSKIHLYIWIMYKIKDSTVLSNQKITNLLTDQIT